MKQKIAIFLLVLGISLSGLAQADTSLLYLRFPTVPPLNLIRVPDSTRFTKEDLANKKATIIMIFSPDCEHCQHETKELKANIGLFKKAQIVMASPLSFDYLKKFYEEYELAAYPNIIMGRDPGYFLGTFYKVRSFPAIFVYNKKGKLVGTFDGSVPVATIADSYK